MTAGAGPSPDRPASDSAARLDSWKEIAAYFQRDVRTVRRWEAAEGLPVHRHQHRERGSVYAYKSELDSWFSTRRQNEPPSPPAPARRPRLARWISAFGAILFLAGAVWIFLEISRPTVPAKALRIVVLPFQGPADDQAAEPLGDVFAGDVVTKLGHLGSDALAVVAYTSAQSYRGSGKKAGQIGRELRTDYVLEGSFRRENAHLLVTVRLVDADDETLRKVWEYLRPSSTLAGLADEVAASVTTTLGLVPMEGPAEKGRAASTIDPEAYDLYLRARYHLSRRTGRVPLARRYLEAALSRAPEFAPAHAALGDAFSRIARGPDAEPDAWARAEASANKALALDDQLPLAHAVLATISLFRDWNWAAAEAASRRAVALDTRDADASNAYAIVLRTAGLMEQAIAQRKRILASDPVNVTLINQLGADYVFARRFPDAIAEFRRALELEPNSVIALDGLADACARAGIDEEAATRTAKLLRLRDSDLADEFERLSRTGGYRAAQRWLCQKDIAQYNQNPTGNAWNLAFTYARLGEKEEALHWLEVAFAQRDGGLLQMAVDPDVDCLRSDPRFKALQGRVVLR